MKQNTRKDSFALSKKNLFLFLLICFIAALALRGFFIFRFRCYAHFSPHEYSIIAHNLLEGKGYYGAALWFAKEDGPTAIAPPFYTFFLYLMYRIWKEPQVYFYIVMMQAVISSVAPILVFFITRRIFSEKAAICAAILAVFDYFLAITAGSIDQPAFHIFFVCVIILFSYRILEPPGASGRNKETVSALFLGFFVGLCALNKGIILAYWFLFSLWFVLRKAMPLRRRIKRIAISSALVLTVISPWLIRNYLVFERFVPIACNFGIRFWTGNNPYANGGLYHESGVPITKLLPEVMSPQEYEHFREIGEIERNDIFMKRAFQFIRDNPLKFLRLRCRAFLYFLTEQSYWMKPVRRPEIPHPEGKYVPSAAADVAAPLAVDDEKNVFRYNPRLKFLTVCMVLAAFAGVFLSVKYWSKATPVILLMFSYTATYTLVHGDIGHRYRLPIEPFLLVFASFFIALVFHAPLNLRASSGKNTSSR